MQVAVKAVEFKIWWEWCKEEIMVPLQVHSNKTSLQERSPRKYLMVFWYRTPSLNSILNFSKALWRISIRHWSINRDMLMTTWSKISFTWWKRNRQSKTWLIWRLQRRYRNGFLSEMHSSSSSFPLFTVHEPWTWSLPFRCLSLDRDTSTENS